MAHLRRLLLLSISSAFLLGCPPAKTGSPTCPSADESTGGLSVEASCEKAEENLLKLECKDSLGRLLGGPNKKGERFASICSNAMHSSVNLRPACVAAAKTCEEVEKCPC